VTILNITEDQMCWCGHPAGLNEPNGGHRHEHAYDGEYGHVLECRFDGCPCKKFRPMGGRWIREPFTKSDRTDSETKP